MVRSGDVIKGHRGIDNIRVRVKPGQDLLHDLCHTGEADASLYEVIERLLLGRTYSGETGEARPQPMMAPPSTVQQPGLETGALGQMPVPPAGQPQADQSATREAAGSAAPGFSFNE